MQIADWALHLAGLFFPSRCRTCNNLLDRLTRIPVCPKCWATVEPLPSTGQCSICGLPVLGSPTDFRCVGCIESEPEFQLSRSYGAYGGVLRELVHLLKYQGMTPLAQSLGARMAATARSQPAPWAASLARCQAVVSVPLDEDRRRTRGYNQAELLARETARHLQLPYLSDACRRVRATPPQAGLTRPQRFTNVKGAFAADSKRVGGLNLLLIDDVMTTGATLDACTQALRHAGAATVLRLTLARALEHVV